MIENSEKNMAGQFWIDHRGCWGEYMMTEAHSMRFQHTHPQYELYFCPRAIDQQIIINGKEYLCKRPCAMLVPPYSGHSMSTEGDMLWTRMVFYFTERTLERFHDRYLPERLEYPDTLLMEFTEEEARELVPLAEAIAKPSNDGKWNERETELGIVLFVQRLFNVCAEENIHVVGNYNLYIQKVLRYVAANYMNDINSEQIAKEFSVSRSKLDRDIRIYAGCSLHEFVDLCRLNRAQELLLTRQKMSVTDIARACGFKNESYFYVFFKKRHNESPVDWRKRHMRK